MESDQTSVSGGKRVTDFLRKGEIRDPLFTVVTAVFNGSETLEATIKSVVNQSYKNFEYVIVDGGSTDGTLNILRRYEHAIDYWISEPDRGVYDAFNKACPLIRGTWTVFLGAGDLFYDENVLEAVSRAAHAAPAEAELIYGRVCLTTGDAKEVKLLNRPWNQMKDRWRGGRPMLPHHQGIFHRKDILAANFPFDVRYRFAADSKLVYTSIERVVPIYCDVIIARAPIGGVSTEPKYFLRTAHEIFRINRDLGYRNYPHQAWFYLKILVKSMLSYVHGETRTKQLIDGYRVLTGRKPHWRG